MVVTVAPSSTSPAARAAVRVVGGGLAGCEAAWQLAQRGIAVDLVEMRPQRTTGAHRTGLLAELVCSNSLRSDNETNAVGLLKREMEALGSLVMAAARGAAVPAGSALAVDRDRFAESITAAVSGHPLVNLERREVEELPAGPAVIATGPLTSAALHRSLGELIGESSLHFFDAVAPVVAGDSLDHSRLFRASRYGKGGADYLNAPFDRAEYEAFVGALLAAATVPFEDFEVATTPYFEGCLPVEVMAERGIDTLRFGPMKPVGLRRPDGSRPWAVVQLRQDDLAAEHWNLVGFQTKLTQAEQRRVFRMIPGLENARFVRFGMVHRNTFVEAPVHLDRLLRLKACPSLWLAGQLTGVEGYLESAATGLLVGVNLAATLLDRSPTAPPPETALGGLVRHLTERPAQGFQPSNVTWGLIQMAPELAELRDRASRRRRQVERALAAARGWLEGFGFTPVGVPSGTPP